MRKVEFTRAWRKLGHALRRSHPGLTVQVFKTENDYVVKVYDGHSVTTHSFSNEIDKIKERVENA